MSPTRNIKYLHLHKIIYRSYPTTDIPTNTYDWGWHYENGTAQCYTLFNTDFLINSLKSLVWHLCVIKYLNNKLDESKFVLISKFISKKSNGFVTFTIDEEKLESIINNIILNDPTIPPKNKLRKIIFRPLCGLTKEQKQKIVGSMVGRKVRISNEDIYDCMLQINNDNEVITIVEIASLLSCSKRTIIRNMGDDLRKEKDLLNKSLVNSD